MSAFVTDQFRILNTNSFISAISDNSDYYYVFFGLSNPGGSSTKFGRVLNWDDGSTANSIVPDPTDNFHYLNHYKDTIIFGKRVIPENVRRCIRKVEWKSGVAYDMYRHDYSINNTTSETDRSRLYDGDYYVINSQYQVYICISNGSNGDSPSGNTSRSEPTFTDLEPSFAGDGSDGYLWKYLFTVPPSDIIKFDSTEFIPLPNNWSTSSNTQISNVRNNGDSSTNNNQIKFVYIKSGGNSGYTSGEVDIYGDGTGAKVYIETDNDGKIVKTSVTSGGSGYTYGIVDLGPLQTLSSYPEQNPPAELIPIIPPSKGHGYDLYAELGADKVLIYNRFDDSVQDFPTDTKFAQIGVLKNPTEFSSSTNYIASTFSGLYSIRVTNMDGSPVIGEKFEQNVTGGIAKGYVGSYNAETKILKYYKDRSLYYHPTSSDYHKDHINVSTTAVSATLDFNGSNALTGDSGWSASIDTTFTGSSVTVNNKTIDLDVNINNGLASPEINKTSGDIIFIDNRPLIERNPKQKEDIKIILEF